jgi:hypothetical protein
MVYSAAHEGRRAVRLPARSHAADTCKEPMKELSPELRSFVLTLPSVPFLEALLLLHGAPGQVWTAEAIAQRLYLQSVARGHEIVRELAARGFCATTPDGQSMYRPADAALHRMTAELAREYQQRLIEITRLIHG